jgi:hypothetical protein
VVKESEIMRKVRNVGIDENLKSAQTLRCMFERIKTVILVALLYVRVYVCEVISW